MRSFRRGIRIFRSQDIKIESRPSCLGKTYPRKNEEQILTHPDDPFNGLHRALEGSNFASSACNKFGTSFSLILIMICISGGCQDLPPGFYQVLTLAYLGGYGICTRKAARNLIGKNARKTCKTISDHCISHNMFLVFLAEFMPPTVSIP